MTKKPMIGDLFELRTDASTVRHFQYVADDATQLNSNVVRVFQDASDIDQPLDVERIADGKVAFHAHVFLGLGLKQKLWRKVGRAQPPDVSEVLFRDTNDYGDPKIVVSQNWHVWKINGPFKKVGKLLAKDQHAEVGVVVPPDSLVYRARTGRYDFVYPDY